MIVICSVRFFEWLPFILLQIDPWMSQLLMFFSSVTGKEHPAHPCIPKQASRWNGQCIFIVHSCHIANFFHSRRMFTRFWWNQSWAASLFASAWHWSTITAVTRQKVGGIDGHKSAVSKSLHKLDLGLSCIHATEFNQQLQVLFLTQPTLHAVTYNQRFGVTRAMLLLSQVLKFLLLLVSLRIKRLLTNTAKITKGWHAM